MADNQALIEIRDGGYYAVRSRVTLASIIYAFRRGDSPETIQRNFDTLSLAQVYSALAFYLNNEEESEAYLREYHAAFEKLGAQAVSESDLNPQFVSAREKFLATKQ